MMTRVLIVLGLCVVTPAVSAAQGIATSFQELRLLVHPGDTVTVTDANGQTASGKITDLSSSSLALTIDHRPREWRESEVARITQRRGDSLANGALIGLAIGAGGSAIAGAVWDANNVGDTAAGEYALVIAIYAGLGAAVGTGLDALIRKRQVIFEKGSASGVTVQIAPLLSPTRAAARLSVGF